VLARHSSLDVLVSNAGIGGSSEPADTWMANHIGPSIFISELQPLLEKTAKASGVRLVFVSSSSHKDGDIDYEKPYERVKQEPNDEIAYRQSKLAQIMYMRALQGRMRAKPGLSGESAVRCMAISPGVAFTNIFPPGLPAFMKFMFVLLFRTPFMGAQVIKMAAVDPAVVGGSFLTNCHVVPSSGQGDVSNKPEEWEKLWALTEKCAADDKYA